MTSAASGNFLRGQAYKLRQPYIHTDGATYNMGWIHLMKGSTVFLLLEKGITDEFLRSSIRVIQGKEIRSEDLIVEFGMDAIGELMPFAFGGVYAGDRHQ